MTQVTKSVRIAFLYAVLALVFALGFLLKYIPLLRNVIIQAFSTISNTSMAPQMYWDSLFSRTMLRSVISCSLIDLNKKVKLGEKAYSCPVVSAIDQRPYRLLDLARGERPLVLNFGSVTCPVFRQNLKVFEEIVRKFNHSVDFAIVYIEEAHPKDGWAFKDQLSVPRHRSMSDRCCAAQLLNPVHPCCTVAVDTMLDAANIAYGAVPIRLYIVQEGTVVYQGGPGPMAYYMEETYTWLKNYIVDTS